MSNISIYTGIWYDQSRSKILGATVTLPIRWGNYLIATLSVLVTICAASFWTIEAFGLHQAVVGRQDVDAVDLQQQVILRNSSSAIVTIWELVKVQMAWRGRAASRLRTRTVTIVVPALLTWLVFTAGSIFVAEVASRSYDRVHVLVNPENCGFADLDINDLNGLISNPTAEKTSEINLEGLYSFTEKLKWDTVDARAYARSWYGNSPTLFTHNSIFPVARLPYIVNTSASCPFSETGICMPASNSAMTMDTGLLNSHSILGINARVQDRVDFQRMVTCAPLNVDRYVDNYIQPITTNLWNMFYLGPLSVNYPGLVEGESQPVTFAFDTGTQINVMDYVLFSISYSPGGLQVWNPITPFKRTDADVSLHFVAQTSVIYTNPVLDPIFSATTALPFSDNVTMWLPDRNVSVLGCIDQYRICNSDRGVCTPPGGVVALSNAITKIGLNNAQLATALRLHKAAERSLTWLNGAHLGANALLAKETVSYSNSAGLPPNQWQLEAHRWFVTDLAKFQSYIIQYASNKLANLGTSGYITKPRDVEASLGVRESLDAQCRNQRIQSTAEVQSFSLLGLLIVIATTFFCLVASLALEQAFARMRRGSKSNKSIAREADEKLQLLRMAVAGEREAEGWMSNAWNVPIRMSPAIPGRPQMQNGLSTYSYSVDQFLEA